MILSFFGDESYNKKVFTFGGFMASKTEWEKLETEWKEQIKWAGVSRFHASHLNCYKYEFANWTKDQSKNFVKPLLEIIKNRKMIGFSFAMLLDDYEKYTTAIAKNKLGTPYLCCFKHCIALAAQGMSSMPPEVKFEVIIDRNPEEKEAVKLFDQIKNDSNIPYRHRLATCVSGGWEKFLPLQTADMIAYDTFKLLEDTKLLGKTEFRKSLKAIFDSTPLFGNYFDKESFDSIRDKIESTEHQSILVEDSSDFR